MGYIYKTINLINGRIYIGQHSKSFTIDYLGSGTLILKALKKYGKENFKIEVLAYANSKEMLDSLEKKYISEYRRIFGKEFLYNLAEGGNGSLGWHPSLETINKMSESRKGEKNHNFGMDLSGCKNPMFGKNHSEETKEKMRHKKINSIPWNVGIQCTEETKNKIKKSLIKYNQEHGNAFHGKKHTEEAKNKIKASWIIRKMRGLYGNKEITVGR